MMIKKGTLLAALVLLPACASVEDANDMADTNETISTTVIPDLPEGELTNEMFEAPKSKTR